MNSSVLANPAYINRNSTWSRKGFDFHEHDPEIQWESLSHGAISKAQTATTIGMGPAWKEMKIAFLDQFGFDAPVAGGTIMDAGQSPQKPDERVSEEALKSPPHREVWGASPWSES
jgi:hypothetical protein